jgi:hypothetical protein
MTMTDASYGRFGGSAVVKYAPRKLVFAATIVAAETSEEVVVAD